MVTAHGLFARQEKGCPDLVAVQDIGDEFGIAHAAGVERKVHRSGPTRGL
jgi:hypothetical protein